MLVAYIKTILGIATKESVVTINVAYNRNSVFAQKTLVCFGLLTPIVVSG